MCTFYTVKYLCNCIYDEWRLPCFFTRGPQILTIPSQSTPASSPAVKPTKPRCYHTRIIEIYDVLTLCEVCYMQLDAQIQTHGVKTLLAAPERFPLAEKLGMLIVVGNDEDEQWRVFRRGEQVFILEREVKMERLEGVGRAVQVKGSDKGGRVRRPRRRNEMRGWKYEASKIYQLGYTIYDEDRTGREVEQHEDEESTVPWAKKSFDKRTWQGTYYEERALGHYAH
ncbi:uncharacterized protein BJX67DRAFT_376426 [Aspergillus lucknowensis]|uniref:Uncharacterized protein n=1 Tax=Aspergillus lucknowensis TaxID=176173 RepID=A0ABR4M7P2_9EURO